MPVFCYALLTIFFAIFCYQIGKKNSFTPSSITRTNDNKEYSLLPEYDAELALDRSRYKKNKISESKSSQYSSFKDTRMSSPPTPFSPPPITQIIPTNSVFTITSHDIDNDSLSESSGENDDFS